MCAGRRLERLQKTIVGTRLISALETSKHDVREVLEPFEIRHNDTPRIREHVGDDENTPLREDAVSFWGCRAVGTLQDNAGSDLAGVLRRQLIFDSRRD